MLKSFEPERDVPGAVRAVRRRPKWLIVAANARHNFVARWRLSRGRFDSDIGATHRNLTTDQSVSYINRVFSDYLAYGELNVGALAGARVLELGPGDNLGVALRFYAAGASQVVCLDKFYARRDATQQATIYAALREQLAPSERVRFDQALSLDGTGNVDPACVRYLWGRAAADAPTILGEQSVDMVVSRAVLWEIFEIGPTLRALDCVLRPGGAMIHKIACLDWMFPQQGYHPLEFLTVPDLLYGWMARDSGKSNRCTIDFYRRAMRELGYRMKLHITRVVGRTGQEFPPGTTELLRNVHYTDDTLGLVNEIRPRLLARFRCLSDEDLMVQDMFLVAIKSGVAQAAPSPGSTPTAG